MNLTRLFRMTMAVMFSLLVIEIVLSTIIYPKNSIIIGLIFGTLISIVYIFMMANRIKKMEHIPLEQMIAFMKTGSVMRFTLIMVSLYFVFRSSNINLYGAGIGVVIGPIMIAVIGFIDALKGIRRGE